MKSNSDPFSTGPKDVDHVKTLTIVNIKFVCNLNVEEHSEQNTILNSNVNGVIIQTWKNVNADSVQKRFILRLQSASTAQYVNTNYTVQHQNFSFTSILLDINIRSKKHETLKKRRGYEPHEFFICS